MKKFGIRTLPSLLMALIGVISVLFTQPARSFRPIIQFPREFDPVGMLHHDGRQVTVALVGGETAVPCNPGDIHEYSVLIVQSETGAQGVGFVKAPCGQPNPDFIVNVRLLPGSPSFQEGPAVALAEAEVRNRGKVIRDWSWSLDVLSGTLEVWCYATLHRFIDHNDDGAFAELCLTTWLPRRDRLESEKGTEAQALDKDGEGRAASRSRLGDRPSCARLS